jgi:hypothetical protein
LILRSLKDWKDSKEGLSAINWASLGHPWQGPASLPFGGFRSVVLTFRGLSWQNGHSGGGRSFSSSAVWLDAELVGLLRPLILSGYSMADFRRASTLRWRPRILKMDSEVKATYEHSRICVEKKSGQMLGFAPYLGNSAHSSPQPQSSCQPGRETSNQHEEWEAFSSYWTVYPAPAYADIHGVEARHAYHQSASCQI